MLYSTTGPYGPVRREMVNGIMLAIDEVNADPDNGFELVPVPLNAARINDTSD
jgi:urea transport system substrate-binding protein